jgi:hypothetical protein
MNLAKVCSHKEQTPRYLFFQKHMNEELKFPVKIASDVSRNYQLTKWIRVTFYILAVTLGLVQTWNGRHFMEGDGIAYLDVADAYFRGDWNSAINAYWSPFYPLVLGLVMTAVHPSPYWECAVLHVVNFSFYLLGFICFDFMLRELIHFQKIRLNKIENSIPEWGIFILAYPTYIYTSLIFINITTPFADMCLLPFTYLAFGLLLRIWQQDLRYRIFIILGGILGCAYLTKAAMFPLSFIFLGVSFFLVGHWRRSVPRALMALLAFCAVSGPFILALSVSKGYFTFGDSGRLNYAWWINDVHQYIHWQGGPTGNGTPIHPTRKLLDHPQTFEFGLPVSGTYPPWFDPTYWYKGLTLRIDLEKQIKIFKAKSQLVGYLFFTIPSALVALIILVLSGKFLIWFQNVRACWFLIIPALAALLMYSMLHVDPRYIASFSTVLWLCIFISIALPSILKLQRLFKTLLLTSGAIFLVTMLTHITDDIYFMIDEISNKREIIRNEQWYVARSLSDMGLRPGDRVAYLGKGHDAYWARLGKVKIVAEIPVVFTRADDFFSSQIIDYAEIERFWKSPPDIKKQVVQALANSGANMIVCERVPSGIVPAGWQKVGTTTYYAYPLSQQFSSAKEK